MNDGSEWENGDCDAASGMAGAKGHETRTFGAEDTFRPCGTPWQALCYDGSLDNPFEGRLTARGAQEPSRRHGGEGRPDGRREGLRGSRPGHGR